MTLSQSSGRSEKRPRSTSAIRRLAHKLQRHLRACISCLKAPFRTNHPHTSLECPVASSKRPIASPSSGHKPLWQEIAARKREENMEDIPPQWRLCKEDLSRARDRRSLTDGFIDRLLDSQTRELTNLDAPALQMRMRDGSLSAVDVVLAYCRRAAYAHQLNDTLLEIGFSRALQRARELDAFFEAEKRTVGPLHGLPITLKDQFHVRGMGTTMGYVGWIDTFEGDEHSPLKYCAESELVRQLEALGAIVIAKTTLVQTLWYGETNNNILGYNNNPTCQHLSSGGSSGGEGAIQAMRGSVFGIGSDIGGSVSMPAACNGVFSIKPSAGRLSTWLMANSSPGQTIIPTVPGLLSSSILSLRYAMEALLSNEPWLADPALLPIPWRPPSDVESGIKLCFGFMDFDGVVRPHPPITRALNLVKAAVEEMGHKVIPWSGPPISEAVELHHFITGSNGNWDIFENLKLSGEPLIPQLRPEFPSGKPNLPKDVKELEEAVLRLKQYRVKHHKAWAATQSWTGTGRPIDAVILPVLPSAAVIPDKLYHYDYISHVNVIDHATMVIPVDHADKAIDKPDPGYVPVGEKDRKNWEAYDPEAYHGAPTTVQLLGGRLQEERLLAIGQIVVDAINKYKRRQKKNGFMPASHSI